MAYGWCFNVVCGAHTKNGFPPQCISYGEFSSVMEDANLLSIYEEYLICMGLCGCL